VSYGISRTVTADFDETVTAVRAALGDRTASRRDRLHRRGLTTPSGMILTTHQTDRRTSWSSMPRR
jgi:uncharacterized protein (DUF2126 family)